MGHSPGSASGLLLAIRLAEEVSEEDKEEHALHQQHPGRQPRPVAVLNEEEPHALRPAESIPSASSIANHIHKG